MDFRFTEEQDRFRQEVRDFLTKQLPADWMHGGAPDEETDEWWDISQKFLQGLAEKGWLSFTWPKTYGGQERPLWEDAILGEELAFWRAPVMDYWYRWKMISALLLHFGTDEQKQKHLPGIAKGEVYWCQGFSEPEAGSDLGGVQVRAEEKDDCYLINGQKIWTTGAHRAHWCFAPLMTDPDAEKRSRRLSMFVIDMKTPGITVNRLESIEGAAHLCETFFDDVRVPKENLVGERGRGWLAAMVLVNIERSGAGFASLPQRILNELVQFARETKHNGVPLSQNPVIRHKLSQMAIDIQVCRMLAYRTAWIQATGQDVTSVGAIIKLFGSEMMQRVSNTGLQILGQYAQLVPGSRWAKLGGVITRDYMWNLSITIAGGTSEIQRIIISTMGLGLPRM
ncbi:MAG: acyl-CoA dehydrogenase family protein [Dehalococcoidia bacterium]|nr:MAG: acyl-CoA dehydrogenase family protein [Dehalococcoidia bacterium]